MGIYHELKGGFGDKYIITEIEKDQSKNVQACHKLQVQSNNATEICECWDTQAAAVEVVSMMLKTLTLHLQ